MADIEEPASFVQPEAPPDPRVVTDLAKDLVKTYNIYKTKMKTGCIYLKPDNSWGWAPNRPTDGTPSLLIGALYLTHQQAQHIVDEEGWKGFKIRRKRKQPVSKYKALYDDARVQLHEFRDTYLRHMDNHKGDMQKLKDQMYSEYQREFNEGVSQRDQQIRKLERKLELTLAKYHATMALVVQLWKVEVQTDIDR